jgi:chromosome segregation ATPase
MENFQSIIQLLLLFGAALGGFKQYILKPYFEHRDEERAWREKLEKTKEEKNLEKERREDERARAVGDKYQQLAESITELSAMVRTITEDQHNIHINETKIEGRLLSHDKRIDGLEHDYECLHKKVYDE